MLHLFGSAMRGPCLSKPGRVLSSFATSCCSGARAASTLIPAASAGMGNAVASTLQKVGLEVELVKCLDDNYCPLIHHKASGATIVTDTPDAKPILAALKARNWVPTHILNTHHHADHVGGNLEIKREYPAVRIFGPRDRVYTYPGPYPPAGPENEQIPGVDTAVGEDDEVTCGGLKARVLEVGGHTDGHIAYYFASVPLVLAGDCLFTMGCGRVFTGDFARMQVSLQKLRNLPDETIVYCAHEYTESNVKFALQVEPANKALHERAALVAELRSAGLPTVPSLMSHERATNPMLRWDAPAVQEATGEVEPKAVFTAVRRWKDTGKAPRESSRL
eukprot:TRINITY_DN1952_c0_g1_i1.p1 TRINITY_DN1952_c0_g1~~TRINITY_DN1952_c0_g1_i1.p1  ORF type:complete len:334 (-),score=39.27 TRINITY_DN1952_c0_g1_i1:149-1150(-)